MGGGRCRAEAHGHRPGACRPQGACESRDETRADGSRRSERGVRAAVPRGRAGAGPRSRPHERVRRRDRHRPSASGNRDSHHDPPASLVTPGEEAVRAWLGVHWRRTGRSGHRRGAVSDILVTAIGVIVLYLFAGLRVLREYERGVYFVLGQTEMDELLASREKVNAILRQIIDTRTEEWGIEVSAVEVKDVDLPPEMKRAMARQAEAERERRAKVINAEGELQAAEKLAQAAHIIGKEPAAIQLRYLQTVNEIASENNSTTIFPIPIDLFKGFIDRLAPPPPPTGNPPAALPERAAGAGERLPAVRNKGKAKV